MRLIPDSLRGRLVASVILVFMGANAVLVISGYRAAVHEVDELFDAELAHYARVLNGLVISAMDEPDAGLRRSLIEHGWDPAGHPGTHAAAPSGHAYESKIAFQAWLPDGRLVARSRSAPENALAPASPGFGRTEIGGVAWRVFTLTDDEHDLSIQVGQQLSIREELERAIALRGVEESLYSIPLILALVWLTVGLGMRPLRRLSNLIARRDYDNLQSLPVQDREPSELRPIRRSLNALFGRLKDARMRERRFLDEAAHELRTPLAALQVHAENALHSEDGAERDRCLRDLVRAGNRAGHLATQLLTLARLESEGEDPPLGPVSLSSVLEEELVLLAAMVRARGQRISVHMPADLPEARGNADLLAIAVRNLLDNAIRYSPAGSTVRVTGRAEGAGVALEIVDEGPGIPAPKREQVWERFARLNGRGEGGTGLGMAIVARIVDRHGASVRLGAGPDGCGLKVTLDLPRMDEKRA